MENVSIPSEEVADYEEYKQRKRNLELKSKLQKLEPTLLDKYATLAELKNFCAAAMRYHPACVCVQPIYVKTCSTLLRNSGIGVCCQVGGNSESTPSVKFYECKRAFREGASEVNYAPCAAYLLNGNYPRLKREIRRVVRYAKTRTVKIDLDVNMLTRDKIFRAAETMAEAGAKILSLPADGELICELQNKLRGKCFVKARDVESVAEFKNMVDLSCVRVSSAEADKIVTAMERELNTSLPVQAEKLQKIENRG
jgi:deoxyribose-phosphate aldolase